MGYHEQLSSDSPLRREVPIEQVPKPEVMLLADNRTQVALMNIWNEQKSEKERIPHSDLALTWIEEGMAERFGDYVDKHKGEKVDSDNPEALSELLSAVEKETAH